MLLFPQHRLQTAGSEIQRIIQEADQNPEQKSKISELLAKHFGGMNHPNAELIPNAPAGEKQKIMALLKHEIATQGQGNLTNVSFKDLQSFKQGASIKGKWDKSISSAEQELYRNISRKYGDVLKEALPEIKQPYKEYADAANTLKEHGAGVSGLLHNAMYGGGLAGWALRNATIYPAIRGIAHLLLSNEVNKPNPQQGSAIGFRGQVS